MNLLYNIIVYSVIGGIRFVALFNKKLSIFVKGRNAIFSTLAAKLAPKDEVIWFHSASLGEFEQGIPIIEKLKAHHPNYKILVTFFSPSGYEVRKNYPLADCVSYLPFDTPKNAQKFIASLNIKLAIFIKYEFWPNFLKALKQNQIPTLLVSGIFRNNQLFFKAYGGFYRNSLQSFNHFFVQNQLSKDLLNNIGITAVSLSGDTRFDRVFSITKQAKKLDFIAAFTKDKITLVAGSTWPEDEEILMNYINNFASDKEKFILAPHNIKEAGIKQLINSCQKTSCCYSDPKKDSQAQVLVIDSIGLLTSVYGYATIAYVGGGFNKSGIHNILEPASYGLPIIIGPNYEKFNEAKALIQLGACTTIADKKAFNTAYLNLIDNAETIPRKGALSKTYILKNIGATDKIYTFIKSQLNLK